MSLIYTLIGGALLLLAAGYLGFGPVMRWLVPKKLGPYRIQVNELDAALPERASASQRVAVIGGGLAGIAAASVLARRGLAVTLFEKNAWLGGKVGSFPVELRTGESVFVSHGYHAFFDHYYNLNRFLDELGLLERFDRIEDYVIFDRENRRLSFGGLEATPVLNLLSLARRGMFRYRDVLLGPAKDYLGVFLEYRKEKTFAELDAISFEEFAEIARLPPALKLAFNTFSRAFFSDEDRLSLAELVKCFHFYFLGHDGGLVYRYPRQDYEPSLLAPIRSHLRALDVDLRLGRGVESLERQGDRFTVDGDVFDAVVLASDVVGTSKILGSARGLEGVDIDSHLQVLRPGQRYAVLRLWLSKDIREDIPVFVITDRHVLLDALAVFHRLEDESRDWSQKHGGSVIELHSYAVPDDVPDDAEVRRLLLEEMERFFPELSGAEIREEHLQVKQDFTAFHVGRYAARPGTHSGIDGLYFAGDWVKLEFPAMLMEGAFASGMVAANEVLRRSGLRAEPVYSVPLEGLMAGFPAPPARRRLQKAGAP